MTFPRTIIFADQQEYNRFLRDIVQPAAEAGAEAMMIRYGKLNKYMKMSEAQRLAHSELRVKNAMKSGDLKYIMKGRNYMILRSDFNKWQLKHTL